MSSAPPSRYSFTEEEFVDRTILCQDESIEVVDAFGVIFHRPVRIAECIIKRWSMMGGGFHEGAEFEGCQFTGEFMMQSTGHNLGGTLIRFARCIFETFADFEDCWFEGPVAFIDCEFRRGTNLLGNQDTPVEVSFDVTPTFERVNGDLHVNTFNAQQAGHGDA